MVCPRVVCLFKKKHRCYFIIVEKNVIQIQGAWKGKISSDYYFTTNMHILINDEHISLSSKYLPNFIFGFPSRLEHLYCLVLVLSGLIHLTMYFSVLFIFFFSIFNKSMINLTLQSLHQVCYFTHFCLRVLFKLTNNLKNLSICLNIKQLRYRHSFNFIFFKWQALQLIKTDTL